MPELADRAAGAFLGLAMGDAYGRPLEFVGLPRVRDVAVPIAPGAFHWTDDTHMALYLGRAVLDLHRWDREAFGAAVASRWVEWLHDPLTPSTAPGGTCLTGARAIERGVPWSRSGVADSDGCGAVMRIVPLPIALDGDELLAAAEISAATTHRHPNALEAALAASWITRRLFDGAALDTRLVEEAVAQLEGPLARGGVVARSLKDALAQARRDDPWLDEGGVHPGDGGWRSGSALGLALVAALRWQPDFVTVVDRAARIAGDSDSVACLAGMFLGAAYGRGHLPAAWRAALPQREAIERLAEDLVLWGQAARSPVTVAPPPEVRAPAARTSATDPIDVAWLPAEGPGRLGLTFAPGKRAASLSGSPWQRDLGQDLDRLVAVHRVDLLVPLIEDHELASLRIPALVAEAEARGVVVHRLPIPDGATPALGPLHDVVSLVLAFVRAGRRVVVHCRGGLGRAGTVGAACLVALGASPAEAMARVRRARPGAIENRGQEELVERLTPGWAR